MKPQIAIVGAGPGDPELITLKAAKAIQRADAILYDALVDPCLLSLARTDCEIIYVGKRAGQGYLSQDEIKLLMVQTAYRKGYVVRLKGGDPMVFGRGFEELNYAKSFGISVDVIPGISSALATPLSQQIPLTHRDHAHSFWVVTATAKHDGLGQDLSLALQSSATIVILMGIRRLPQIVSMLKAHGKDETPIMIVQNATAKNEQSVIGTVDDIQKLAEAKNIGTPGTIVVGDVVGLHPEFALHYIRQRF